MTFLVRRTRLADEDLLGIWRYIADHNPVAADNLLDAIEYNVRCLVQSPYLGVRRDDIIPGILCVREGKYLIFYRFQEGVVEILRVLHGSRDIKSVFSQ